MMSRKQMLQSKQVSSSQAMRIIHAAIQVFMCMTL